MIRNNECWAHAYGATASDSLRGARNDWGFTKQELSLAITLSARSARLAMT